MPPIPPKPQIVSSEDGGAIIAWLGTYPAGTTFNVYWESGTIDLAPVQPYSQEFETGLRARTSSVRIFNGTDQIPNDTNIYVAVTSVGPDGESAQSSPIFLSICNATNADQVAVGRDLADQNKMLLTDEKGRIFVTTDANAPIVVDETTLNANDPEIIPVGGTPVALPTTPLTNRKMMVIQNQGNTPLNVGLSGSESYIIQAGTTLTFTVGESSSIFGVRAGIAEDVCIWEFN